jgi:hypothetical protein
MAFFDLDILFGGSIVSARSEACASGDLTRINQGIRASYLLSRNQREAVRVSE